MKRRGKSPPFSVSWFARHERVLTGINPHAALAGGKLHPKARVFIAGWNLKDVVVRL